MPDGNDWQRWRVVPSDRKNGQLVATPIGSLDDDMTLHLAPLRRFSHSLHMKKASKREFSVLVERDEDGYYVASVPELRGCHTQARSLDKLMERVREAIKLCLEVEHDESKTEFVGVQRIAV